MNELFVSFLVVGGFNYHSLEDVSSLRSHHLYPIFISKNEAILYGLSVEIGIKFSLVLPFFILTLPIGLSFVFGFFISSMAFISILYLLCDLSGINKVYLNLFRVITLIPIALIDFSSLFNSKENFIEIYIKKNHISLMFSISIMLIIIFMLVFVVHRKGFFQKIID